MLEFINVLDEASDIDTALYENFEDYMKERERAGKSGSGLVVVHFNIRGLRKHFDEFLVYVSTAKGLFDIIVLSETRNISNINDYCIPDYNIYYNEALFNICDGVVIYIKSNLSGEVK